MKKKAERIALIGLLGALALVLGILENLLPPLPGMPPGAKAGLSNLVTMFAAGRPIAPRSREAVKYIFSYQLPFKINTAFSGVSAPATAEKSMLSAKLSAKSFSSPPSPR